jgi:alkyl hydroperoxide reductase subunit AhpC
MTLTIGSTPALAADAYVRGERRRCIGIEEFRGAWVVLALGARTSDIRDLAPLEPAFEGAGAVVLAATAADYHDVEAAHAEDWFIRFPVLTDVDETRRITLIVDPSGVVRHVGLQRSARETLAALETTVSAQRALCPHCGRAHDAAADHELARAA